MKGSKKRILDYLHIHKSITSVEAFTELGCTRLSARIKDLRDMGYNNINDHDRGAEQVWRAMQVCSL